NCYKPPPEFPLASPYSGIVHHLSGPNINALPQMCHKRSALGIDAPHGNFCEQAMSGVVGQHLEFFFTVRIMRWIILSRNPPPKKKKIYAETLASAATGPHWDLPKLDLLPLRRS
ncbi:hypothetical protein B0H17DRAFT_1245808, partial [Mycena rosella]